ncbi:pirin family protein [Thauera linaloolentis]|uniref:Putative pirin protein n=1 Tax=Thauera linaloolentis (strain DSM 12138 / JCM 21573 / CCUG 41526 / CIP 105981 / IAM 15112 / NBRC 102519 / 47Lol) TaxID=1123367 RepID=N6Y2T7_THAL4|nr:pirin family protein [Thauera linaloolentis]ENO88511.1 putative pirin protein [Thauera linaloolentis 47Lol = DSM 12138]MCM8567474.1 pirin family protein [Thauera linaloolentis]
MTTIERIPLRKAELGEGLTILRALPTRQRRMVGAWCFLDHVGPVRFGPGEGMHVGAHPHTCLQTFTWVVEGRILHRDSLGSEQVIQPGQVNLMTAGAGIVHTEDTLPGEERLHAAQLWIALPPEHAGTAPAFEHYPSLPRWSQDGVACTLLAGRHAGHQAPTRIFTPLLGLDLASAAGGTTTLPLDPGFEYGLLPLEGRVSAAGSPLAGDEFAYLGQGRDSLDLSFALGSRALLLGGAPFGHDITMWWNFVGHDRGYVAQAQADWESGAARFGRVPEDGGRRLSAPPLPWPVRPA